MIKKYDSRNNKLIFLVTIVTILSACNQNSVVTTPSNNISPTPTLSSSIEPTKEPSKTPIPEETTATVTPSNIEQSTPSPSPSDNKTTDISSLVSINGKVYDETGNLLNDILVTVKSLDENNSFYAESETIQGNYVFRNVPVGVRLEITAYKSDKWTTRKQTYVAKSNLQGSPNLNVIDFGDFYSVNEINKNNFYFLSDAPEVSSVTPGRSTSIQNNKMNFKLTFSEPVIKTSVEKNFAVRSLKDVAPINAVLGDGNDGTYNSDGLSFSSENISVVLDKSSGFTYTWDTEGQYTTGKEVTISLSEGRGVYTSNEKSAVYGITLRERSSGVKLLDADGNSALDAGEFLYSSSGVRAKNHIFMVNADREAPYLKEVKLSKSNSKSIIGLVFSEPMIVDGFSNINWKDINYYKVYNSLAPVTLDPEETEVKASSQNAIEISTTQNIFRNGDKIKVEVDLNLKDPAGNFFSQGITNGERDNIKDAIYTN